MSVNGTNCYAVLHAMTGRLEIKDVERVRVELMATLDAPADGNVLAIDLSGIEAADTAGAQLLLAAKRDAERSGLRLEYRSAPIELLRLLELLGLRDAVLGSNPA